MPKNYLNRFREDLKEFHEITHDFYEGKVSVLEYKKFSGGFGSYAQRGGNSSMLRLRLTGGELTIQNLKFIKDSIEKYNIDLIHFTTCQTVQLHNLSKNTVCELITEAFDNGIITRGGGGDYPRNVMCSPLSGIVDEAFDVMPYAKASAKYMLGFIDTVKLPRKLKICFSNGTENVTHATFRDIGFIASDNHTFNVYAAGGLGLKPKPGVNVVNNLPAEKVLYALKTMVDVFTQYGNYTNRAASRTRFLQDTLGVSSFIEIFNATLNENIKNNSLDINPSSVIINKKGDGAISSSRIIKQKQHGLYAVSYHPYGGTPKPEFFGLLYDTIKNMQDVFIRLSPTQGIYIINLTATEAEEVIKITDDGAANCFETSTACIGSDICQVGIGHSQTLLKNCIERVKKENFPDGTLPPIRISGCPSSCGAHQVGTIGFRGGKKPSSDGPKFAFAVYDNGCEELGKEHFGEEIGVMYEDQIPEFLVSLGKEVLSLNMTYNDFRKNYPDGLSRIAKDYL